MKVKLCQGIRHTAVMNHEVFNATIQQYHRFQLGFYGFVALSQFSLSIETDNACSMNGDNFAI